MTPPDQIGNRFLNRRDRTREVIPGSGKGKAVAGSTYPSGEQAALVDGHGTLRRSYSEHLYPVDLPSDPQLAEALLKEERRAYEAELKRRPNSISPTEHKGTGRYGDAAINLQHSRNGVSLVKSHGI